MMVRFLLQIPQKDLLEAVWQAKSVAAAASLFSRKKRLIKDESRKVHLLSNRSENKYYLTMQK